MNPSIPNLIPAIPEIIILGMICVAILTDLFVPKFNKTATWIVSQIALIAAFIASAVLYNTPDTTTFSGMFIHDKIASLLKLLIYIISFFAFIYVRDYLREKKIAESEFYILGLFSVLGMMVLVSANSLLIIFLGLEIMSLPLYAMIAMQRQSGIASEAAMKYYIMGAMATGILLYGMSIIYGVAGSLELADIASFIKTASSMQQIMFFAALVFVVVGVAFKLGAAPFHMWAPDVYAGSSTASVLFISSAPKIAATGMMIRLLVIAMPSLLMQWQHLLIVIAILSMSIGNFVAIVQTNIKRMLAYSSIAHMGYMLLGILAGSAYGEGAAVFYIIIYALMSLAAFAVIALMSNQGVEVEHINQLRGLNSRNPWLAFMLLLIMFSMAGIPPTVGFFAKLGVLEALVRAHLVWLAAMAMVFAVIGSYYYLAIVKTMYFEEPEINTRVPLAMGARVAISINSLAVLVLGLFPSALIDLCRRALMGE